MRRATSARVQRTSSRTKAVMRSHSLAVGSSLNLPLGTCQETSQADVARAEMIARAARALPTCTARNAEEVIVSRAGPSCSSEDAPPVPRAPVFAPRVVGFRVEARSAVKAEGPKFSRKALAALARAGSGDVAGVAVVPVVGSGPVDVVREGAGLRGREAAARGASGADEGGVAGEWVGDRPNGMRGAVMGARRLMISEACANATEREEEAFGGPGGVGVDEVPPRMAEKDQVGLG